MHHRLWNINLFTFWTIFFFLCHIVHRQLQTVSIFKTPMKREVNTDRLAFTSVSLTVLSFCLLPICWETHLKGSHASGHLLIGLGRSFKTSTDFLSKSLTMVSCLHRLFFPSWWMRKIQVGDVSASRVKDKNDALFFTVSSLCFLYGSVCLQGPWQVLLPLPKTLHFLRNTLDYVFASYISVYFHVSVEAAIVQYLKKFFTEYTEWFCFVEYYSLTHLN